MSEITAAPGEHQLLDIYNVHAAELTDAGGLEDLLLEAAVLGGATVLRSDFHSFGDGDGVTGVVLLAESHITIHTWPEVNFAALDVFMCGSTDPISTCLHIARALGSQDFELRAVARGARFNITK